MTLVSLNKAQPLLGTAAEWTAQTHILAANQLGIESDTGRMKLGNGSDVWSALAYTDAAILTSIATKQDALTGATTAEIDRFNDVSAYQEAIIAAGALTTTRKYSGLALVGAGAVSLAVPPATMLGQIKVIEMVTDNGDVTLSLANVVGGSAATTCTFNDAGDQLVLIAGASKWIVLKEQGVSMS
jgi:hypothetical protein